MGAAADQNPLPAGGKDKILLMAKIIREHFAVSFGEQIAVRFRQRELSENIGKQHRFAVDLMNVIGKHKALFGKERSVYPCVKGNAEDFDIALLSRLRPKVYLRLPFFFKKYFSPPQ